MRERERESSWRGEKSGGIKNGRRIENILISLFFV